MLKIFSGLWFSDILSYIISLLSITFARIIFKKWEIILQVVRRISILKVQLCLDI